MSVKLPDIFDQSRYFTLAEFECRHTHELPPVGDDLLENLQLFVDFLDEVREEYGRPMYVTSWYRSPNHPVEKRKKYPGPHSTGLAVDIACHGINAAILNDVVNKINGGRYPLGLGFNQRGDIDQRFVHIDVCGPDKHGLRQRPWIWSY